MTLILGLLFSIIVMGCYNNSHNKLNIATASNMQYAMNDLALEFTRSSGIQCNVILGSSGKLLAQIVEGAPYDLFISADEKYPNELHLQGLSESEPRIYAQGQLILFTGDSVWTDLKEVNFNDVGKFVVANSKTAPYGKAAQQVIDHFKWKEKLKGKMVFGESISQTNLFLTTGSADMGLTSQSIAYSGRLDPKYNFLLMPLESYSSLKQAAIILKSSQHKTEAMQFMEYLLSSEGAQVLNKFGYLVPES